MISNDDMNLSAGNNKAAEDGGHVSSQLLKTIIDQLTCEVNRLELAKLAYQESESQLENLLDSVGEGMTLLDSSLNILWANHPSLDRFGDTIIGKKCYQVFHQSELPCDLQRCPALRTFNDASSREYDTQILDQQGNSIDLHCQFNVAIWDNSGKPAAVIMVARDITERTRLKNIIQQDKKEWEGIFDTIGALVAIHDRNLHIVRCNKAFRQAVGLSWKELIGRNCHGVCCDWSRDCATCPLKMTIQNRTGYSSEMTSLYDKSRYLVSTYPIFNDSHDLDGVVRTATDITGIKNLKSQVGKRRESGGKRNIGRSTIGSAMRATSE